ncbi:hypothetical protein QMK33_19395 [Hymenobacter sp. H14-R3]|uniref:hypothetical protein n=1 Tax=Hymenobacter sp. H14-R3 TaxID=3046308 RepID=UPI0024B98405|nr:hypothetical protein [Hymenobacter sp. H14-R3]MDJ0367319.1 hypothetical protein [Hymenobacter sp. H14-R3]
MASQTGILGLQGTVGGLVFAKDGSVRQKPASNKAAFTSSASLARTRENASEFGRAASGGKLIRDSLRALIAAASDRRMVSRLTQKVRAVIAMDTVNGRGTRLVQGDNVASLLGFNFNLGAGIGQNVFFQYTVAGSGANVTLHIPSLAPISDIAPPQGATHFELLFGASLMNFATGTYTQATVAAPLGVLALNSATISNRDVVAAFPAAPTVDEVVVGVLGINFYQQLNGQYYPLNNNSTNPLAIEYIAGSGSVGGGSGNVAYNTNLTGPNDNAQGVTLAASAGDGFGFDALTTGGSAPANMDINVGGAQVASVAYLDRYNGKAFSFTHAGVAHTGAFAATVNF